MELNSCLYECSVMHHRLAPKKHFFQHAIFMFYLDLDELDSVARKTFFFSRNRWNLYAFCDSDHVPFNSLAPSDGERARVRGSFNSHEADKSSEHQDGLLTPALSSRGEGEASLKTKVIDYLARNGIQFDQRGRIMLLTLPRVLGYIFNPVSIYFCFDAAGAPVCSIAEVGNTFREMKLFLLQRDELRGDVFEKLTTKNFYVSPFSSLDLSFDFKLQIPGDKLDIRIDDRDGADKILLSTLTGKRAALTNSKLFWFTLKYPLVTLKVIFFIHWHAMRLWLKRLPFYRKAANPALQCDVLRPHASLKAK